MQFLKNALILLLPVISLLEFSEAKNCDKYGVLLYEDIACKPVKTDNNKCPKKYNCNVAKPKSGCLFKGKTFGSNEEIPSDLTYSACSAGCRCDDPNSIKCAVLSCPEHLGQRLGLGCYFKYELGKCCSTGQNCSSAKTKQCKVDGKTYQIGQTFSPKNTCYRCVCHENFTGKYDNKTCVRDNCNAQIHYGSEITKKCAPAYFNNRSGTILCCPDYFMCPDSSDIIEVVNSNADKDSNLRCSFGKKKLKLGEGLKRTVNKNGHDRNLECQCVLPPFLTCKEI